MRISLLGLGLMGRAIALRLQRQDARVTGWNRGAKGCLLAEEAGIPVVRELSAAVEASEFIILTLSDADAIVEVLGTAGNGAVAGRTWIQMGTIGPAQSRRLGSLIEEAGARYLEAPVLGSIPEAQSGTLIIMAGGEQALYRQCLPVLHLLGKEPKLIGALGQGAALKLAMNQLIASLTAGFSLSLGLVRSEQVEVETFMTLLRRSALYAPTFDKKLGKMLARDYAQANFPLKHLIKDVELFRQVAGQNGMDTSLPAAMSALFQQGVELGLSDADYSALYETINSTQG